MFFFISGFLKVFFYSFSGHVSCSHSIFKRLLNSFMLVHSKLWLNLIQHLFVFFNCFNRIVNIWLKIKLLSSCSTKIIWLVNRKFSIWFISIHIIAIAKVTFCGRIYSFGRCIPRPRFRYLIVTQMGIETSTLRFGRHLIRILAWHHRSFCLIPMDHRRFQIVFGVQYACVFVKPLSQQIHVDGWFHTA